MGTCYVKCSYEGDPTMSPLDIIFLIAQALLGSASIYSLLDNAITVGLIFMFVLYLVTFFHMVYKNMAHKRGPHGA